MKRQRVFEVGPGEGPAFARPRVKRPIDKSLVSVLKQTVGTSQVQTILKTATFPCTIVGLRWEITQFQDAGTAEAALYWAIVINRDGNTVGVISSSDAGNFYTPEQDVLTFGVVSVDNHTDTNHISGSTKTMRKMMGGDELVFICQNVATNTSTVRGIIQFFCKS